VDVLFFRTTGSDENIQFLEILGIDGAVNYQKQDFEKKINEFTKGHGVDIVLEVVGGEVYKKCLRLLRPLGRIVIAGFASMNMRRWNPFSWIRTWRDMLRANILKMAEGSQGVMATHLGYLLPDADRLQHIWGELCSFVMEHEIRPVVGHLFEFDEMAKAHEFMESRGSRGKIVVKVTE